MTISSQSKVFAYNRLPEKAQASVVGFSYLLCASALMSFVPGFNVGTYFFAAVLLAYILYQIFRVKITLSDRRTKACVMFVAFCALSLGTLISNGYGLGEWARAIVPFLFFLTAVFIPKLGNADRRWLSNSLMIASMIWLIRILIEIVFLIYQGSDVLYVRLTFRVIDSVIPFPLVAAPYLMFSNKIFNKHVGFAILVFITYLYIWIGYRAGLVIFLMPIAVLIYQNVKKGRLATIILMAVLAFGLSTSSLFNTLRLDERYASIDSESTGPRGLEWVYAIEQFRESPIIGKGLGWQVPANVAFGGVEDVEGTQTDTVGYVHSTLAYMGMNLGIIGIVLYFFIVLPRPFTSSDDDLRRFSSIALAMLFMFCMTQASFRSIQTVLMTVALFKINEGRRTRQSPGSLTHKANK